MNSTYRKRSFEKGNSAAAPNEEPRSYVPIEGDDLTSLPLRELLLLAGKDGVGKTSALVSLAHWLQETSPSNTCWVLDTENKYRSILKAYGLKAPANLKYFAAGDMNDVTAITEIIVEQHQPGDWMCVESLGRIWERAQDLGYQAVAGAMKADYLEKRRLAKKLGHSPGPVTPRPDDLWNIAKGALNAGFLDRLVNADSNPGTLNVAMTAPLNRVRQGNMDSPDRRKARAEFGLDLDVAGPPMLPYLVETLMVLESAPAGISCRVVRDNLSPAEDPRVEFIVPSKRTWAPTFFAMCREAPEE